MNSNPFYSYNELLKHYVEEKFQLVHYELILDNLYMSKVKDSEWLEKKEKAEDLYQECKDLITFLNSLIVEYQSNSEKRGLA